MADDMRLDDTLEDDVTEAASSKTKSKSKKADSASEKGTRKRSKPSVLARTSKYLRDLKGEFNKIIWPTIPTVVRNTGVTVLMCAIVAVIVVSVDLGVGYLIDLLMHL